MTGPNLPELLEQFEQRHHLTQRAAANRLGIAASTYDKWRAGRHVPAVRRAGQLAALLGVDATVVLGAIEAKVLADHSPAAIECQADADMAVLSGVLADTPAARLAWTETYLRSVRHSLAHGSTHNQATITATVIAEKTARRLGHRGTGIPDPRLLAATETRGQSALELACLALLPRPLPTPVSPEDTK